MQSIRFLIINFPKTSVEEIIENDNSLLKVFTLRELRMQIQYGILDKISETTQKAHKTNLTKIRIFLKISRLKAKKTSNKLIKTA